MSASSSSARRQTMNKVFVGCGSNIDAEVNLRWAIDELARHFGPLSCSSVYQSPAFGFEGPDFLNMVVAFDSDLSADAVEGVLSSLENTRGRDPAARSGSRTLDLDLLLLGERVDAARRLPRIDILRYPFVLGPMAEIAPRLKHPVTGTPIAGAWKAFTDGVETLVRIGALDAA